MIKDTIIDEGFRALIQPLAEDERKLLEENIVRDGCRDALVVWAPHNILLDGHNRYEICQRHGIPYRTTEIVLPDRLAAEDWIDANQLGRRNLAPDQMSIIRGRRYNRAKHLHGGDRKSSGKDCHLIGSTADVLAKQHNVSPKTIRNDGKFAAAVEQVKKIDPKIESKVAKGKGPSRDAITKAAALVDAAPREAEHLLRQSTKRRKAQSPRPASGASGKVDVLPSDKDAHRERVTIDRDTEPQVAAMILHDWLGTPCFARILAACVELFADRSHLLGEDERAEVIEKLSCTTEQQVGGVR